MYLEVAFIPTGQLCVFNGHKAITPAFSQIFGSVFKRACFWHAVLRVTFLPFMLSADKNRRVHGSF